MARYIVFEGLDGAGKDTTMSLVQEWLEETGRTVHLTRTPSTGPVGQVIRGFYPVARDLFPEESAMAAFFGPMMMADMLHHDLEIREQLGTEKPKGDGHWILQSRNWISTWCYQGACRGVRDFLARELIPRTVQPHLVVKLEAEVGTCLERIRSRKQAIVDAFEHRAMLERVRDAWPKITHPSRSPVYDEEVRVAGMREGIPLLRIDTTKVEDPRDNLRKVQDLLGRMFLIHGV